MSPEKNHTLPSEEKRREEPAGNLPGWPGYRTRPGRSGLDPIDNRTEAGHMAGLFIRNVLTATLVTQNPFYLFLFAVLGVMFLTPLVLAGISTFQGVGLPFGGWIIMTLLGFLGLILLINLVRNLVHLGN